MPSGIKKDSMTLKQDAPPSSTMDGERSDSPAHPEVSQSQAFHSLVISYHRAQDENDFGRALWHLEQYMSWVRMNGRQVPLAIRTAYVRSCNSIAVQIAGQEDDEEEDDESDSDGNTHALDKDSQQHSTTRRKETNKSAALRILSNAVDECVGLPTRCVAVTLVNMACVEYSDGMYEDALQHLNTGVY
jgi:hypothetical protein